MCCAPTRCASTRTANERHRCPLGRWPTASAAWPDRPDHRGVRRGGRSRTRLRPGGRALRRHPADPGARVRRPAPSRSARPIRCCKARWRGAWPRPCGRIAAVYITPMAAVAGAVADEMLQALVRGRTLDKAYVNDGGDIAIHLTPGHELRAGIFATALDGVARLDLRPARPRHRHVGPRRTFLLAGHRRFRDRARRDGRCRRRGRDPDRQRGERRSSGDRAPAGARPRSRQRPSGLAGNGRRRSAARGSRRRGPGSRCGRSAAPQTFRPDRQRRPVAARSLADRCAP